MATVSIFDLDPGTSLASGDVLPFVDVSDITQSPEGSTLKITIANFFAAVPVPITTTGLLTSVGVNYGAGTLVGTGSIALNTNKFTVAGSTGNALIAGTLTVNGATVTLAGNLVCDALICKTTQDFTLSNMGASANLASWHQSTGVMSTANDLWLHQTSDPGLALIVGRGTGNDFTNAVFGLNTLQHIAPNQGAQTGINMIAIGSNTLLNSVNGFNCIAIGNSALQASLSYHNYAIGHVALVALTTGDHNVAVGSVCMQNLTTGVENHSFGIHGFDALIDGSYNTGAGMGHGYLLAHGSNNVMIGRQCGELSTSASNLLLLGWNAQATTATTSNEIVLGNSAHTSFRIPGLGFSIAGSSPTATATMGGHLAVTGTFSTDVIQCRTSNLTIQNVGGGSNLATWNFTTGALNQAFDFSVATSKFTVAASTGNTVVAGTLGVTSDVAVNTSKFTVAASTGNTVVAGTLGVTGDVAIATNKFNITASSGNFTNAGTHISTGQIRTNAQFNVGGSNGLTDTIPNTFTSITVIGGIITAWS